MGKREIPLFVFDKNREHGIGECDFVCCTDIDNGFIAKIDYTDQPEGVTERTRIGKPNKGISLRIEIKRIIGKNPDDATIRTLMKKAESLYMESMQMKVGEKPTDADMINFLDILIDGNKHYLSSAGNDVNERNTVLSSLKMLDSIKHRLIELSGN